MERLRFVEGLRAVAVLAVVVYHAGTHGPQSPYERLWVSGRHGVDLFFVISGFCLAQPVLARLAAGQHAKLDVRGFAARRIARIFPPYLCALALFCILAATPAWNAINTLPKPLIPAHFDATTSLRELFLLDQRPLHNPSFWTLGIELRWYVLFPLALAAFIRYPRALVPACLGLYGLYYWSAFNAVDVLMLPAFLLGILAADVYARPAAYAGLRKRALLLSVAAFAIAFLRKDWDSGPLWHAAAFFFVVAAMEVGWLRAALSIRVLTLIGVASYSIYLVHEPIISAFEHPPAVVPQMAVPLVGLAAGFLFWALVERPLTSRAGKSRLVTAARNALERLEHWCTGIQLPEEPAVLAAARSEQPSGLHARLDNVARLGVLR